MFFSPIYYESLYPDVKQHAKGDYSIILLHWLVSGIKEGRRGSPLFDSKFYLSYYDDLNKAFGTDYFKAFLHWFYYGIKEGRKGIPDSVSLEIQQAVATPVKGVIDLLKGVIDTGKKVYDIMKNPEALKAAKEFLNNAANIITIGGVIKDIIVGEDHGGNHPFEHFHPETHGDGSLDLPGHDPSHPIV